MANVTTTAKETFSHEDACHMALMIYRRFGRDMAAAATAWRRLLQNSCTNADFEKLVREAV